jgi:restriction endonuclease S subunit
MELIKQLGECAKVIRCQLPRVREGGSYDSGLLCSEVTVVNFEQQTGFVSGVTNVVNVQLNPTSKQQKYLIKRNDILISFRGTGTTLGRVGLYVDVEDKIHAICGLSLVIVRALSIDALWLYYFLLQDAVRKYFISKASGDRLLTLNLSDIRDLSISIPTDDEINMIHERHAAITLLSNQIRNKKFDLLGLLLNVEEYYSKGRCTSDKMTALSELSQE